MIRGILGSLLALVGAAAGVLSPFRAWYGGRHGSDIRVDDLFTGVGVTPRDAALLGSLFLPMTFAALLTGLGLLMGSRLVVALAGVLVLGVTILWMVREAQFSGTLTAGGDGLDTGVAFAFLSGALLLSATGVLPGRRALHFAEPPAAVPYDCAVGPPPPYEPTPPYEPKPPYEPGQTQPLVQTYEPGPASYESPPPYDPPPRTTEPPGV